MSEEVARASHLVLVGLPGAGKSTAGRLAAELSGRPFLDFDAEIERREGKRITELFAERGEPWFRALERELTQEVAAAREAMILAPGGGWVTAPELVAMLRPPARLLYLKVRPDTALARMGDEIASRPLLAGDPVGRLRELMVRRGPLYEKADEVVDVELLAVEEVAKRIIASLSRRGAKGVNH